MDDLACARAAHELLARSVDEAAGITGVIGTRSLGRMVASVRTDFGSGEFEALAGAGAVSARKMFGEYGVYCDGKIVGLVCDDQLFVKVTEAGRAWLGHKRGGLALATVTACAGFAAISGLSIPCCFQTVTGGPTSFHLEVGGKTLGSEARRDLIEQMGQGTADPEQAAAEFHRVLRPGGRVAVSTWGDEDPRWAGEDDLLSTVKVSKRRQEPGEMGAPSVSSGPSPQKPQSSLSSRVAPHGPPTSLQNNHLYP